MKLTVITTAVVTSMLALGTVFVPAVASASSRPVVYELSARGNPRPVTRPGTFHLLRGPSVTFTHLRWSSWGSHRARASGRGYACDLGCWSLGHVTIVLYRIRHRAGQPYFTRLHEIDGGVSARWHWHFNYGWAGI